MWFIEMCVYVYIYMHIIYIVYFIYILDNVYFLYIYYIIYIIYLIYYMYRPLGKFLRKREMSDLPVPPFLCKMEVNGLLESDPV